MLMATLKEISSLFTDDAFLGKVVVYLESEEDVQIVGERWFFDAGETVVFKSADEGQGGGSTAVLSKVEAARNKGIYAFGVIDRDILMQQHDWNQWWETDDKKFQDIQPFGTWIHILLCWEIENYLLNPEVLEQVMADREGRSLRKLDTLFGCLFESAKSVQLISAASILAHKVGYKLAKDFGMKQIGNDLGLALSKHLKKKGVDQADSQLQGVYASIEAFVQNNDGNKNKWQSMIRMLDGKRMLSHLNLSDQRYNLASRIRQLDCVPSEWKSFVTDVSKGYNI
ncbi:MAG: hypothetical protein Q9M22_03820 [Mariprofundaceae bacterium]|nr:hypothetical protein [Mariprofundaceae bacterium]